jgi:hypothetical protein
MINAEIAIISANYLKDYKIALKYNDGKTNVVDFEMFIKSSRHSDIQKYQDIQKFKLFNLSYGDLEWNDYELAFPIYDLYQGDINAAH